MDAKEIIKFIQESEKKTPVKLYVKAKATLIDLDVIFEKAGCQVFQMSKDADASTMVVFGDWKDAYPILKEQEAHIADYVIENDCRNSAIPLLDLKGINARIEPGATIRDQVEIGDNAVVMMGATINIGAVIGEGTMIDMGAILGGRATVGKNSHIGAGAVLAGVIEPPSATPVIIGDNVLVGANAVILEGVQVGDGAVVAAGAIVIEDVPAGAVVAGIPARVIKSAEDTDGEKIEIVQALRQL